MLLRLAFKNIISRKSSIVIVAFIAFAVMALIVTNAVFDSSETGLKQTFTQSFTGDFIIRPVSENSLSLFGDETPITGELEKTPALSTYALLDDYLSKNPYISSYVKQVTGMASMEAGDNRKIVNLFGVEGKSYIDFMKSLTVLYGTPFEKGEKGLMLTKNAADSFGLNIGDEVQFVVADGMSVRIRSVPLRAVYSYPRDNPTLERIALIDPETLRALMDMGDSQAAETVTLSESAESLLSGDLDDFFSDTSDLDDVNTQDTIIDYDSDVPETVQAVDESMVWNFVICRTDGKHSASYVIHSLNRYFKTNDINVRAVNWRTAAGSTATYLFILRLILNAGIIIVLTAGLIVVNNTLVINVLDRTTEIGTMRAIGATKNYIRLECFTETILLALASGIAGIILGFIGCYLCNRAGITFYNSFLIQLFGSNMLRTAVTLKNLFQSFMFAILLGSVAWMYPVKVVLGINLVKTMQGGK